MRMTSLVVTLGVVGCGPSVSLDDPEPPGDSSTTSEITTTTTTASSDDDLDDGNDDDASPKLDLFASLDVPPEPLPPGICPPDCQFELSLEWEYDGPPGGAPLTPDDRLVVEVEPGGGVMLAQQRQGTIELARLEPVFGRELWTMPLSLPCDPCQLADMQTHPSGDKLLSGYGPDGAGGYVAFAARVEPGNRRVKWTNAVALIDAPGITPRTGGLVVLEDLLVQPVLDGSVSDGLERLRLVVLEGRTGTLAFANVLTTQLGTGDGPVPLAVESTDDVVAIGHPTWQGTDLLADVTWAHAFGGKIESSISRPSPIVDLAAYGERTISLGLTPAIGVAVLELYSGTPAEPTQWVEVHPVRTDSTPAPVLQIGALGHAYVAMRIATERPGRETDTSIQLMRWSEQGEALWTVALPVHTDYVKRPVTLAVTFDEHLVVGGFVGGVRHVEQRAPVCMCD